MLEPTSNDQGTSSAIGKFLTRERLLLFLLAGTLGVLAWQHWGMNTILHLDPRTPRLRPSAILDKADGGNSVCTVSSDGREWRLDYDVRQGVSWAYCGINLAFVGADDSSRGMDLSRFDTMFVSLGGISGPNSALQTQLKVMDRTLYRPGDGSSLKYFDMVLFPSARDGSRDAMPLDNFSMPTWWVARNRIPADRQNQDRSDLREIEFLTSADIVRFGTGTVRIRSIEFHGKWIRRQRLLDLLFGFWITYIIGGLVVRLYRSFRSNEDLRIRAQRLLELAERDPLTGLHNRRGLESHIPSIVHHLENPENGMVGVLMLDLDHFKSINDSLGHDGGDEILRKTARLLLEEMRPTNLAARWGGEEFILLLPGIPPERLAPAAEKVRSRIESDLHYQGRAFTASIGAAMGDLDDFDELVKRADEALYRAKANGRNRVEMAL